MEHVTVTTPNSDTDTVSDSVELLDHIDIQVHEIGQKVSELVAVLDEFRPLLALLKGADGRPDVIGAAQIARRFRRGRS